MSTSKPENLKIVKELGRKEILFSVARQPNTSRVFLGASDSKVYDVDVMAEKPEPVELAGHESYVTGTTLAGKYLISGAYDGRLIWWDTETRQQVRSINAHSRWIRGVTATPDGRYVLSVSDDMLCRVWDVETGTLVRDLVGHAPRTPHHFPSMLYACAVSPDGRYAATADRIGKSIVWDLHNGRRLATVEAPIMYTWDPKQRIHSIGGIRSVAFSADSSLLAVGGIGTIGNIDHLDALGRVEIFDWQKGERVHELAGDTHKGLVERLIFHPQGDWLLAAGGDHGGFIQFYNLADGKIIKQDKAPMHVHDVVLNESADMLYAAGHGKAVVWSLQGEA